MKPFWVTFYSYKGGVGRSMALVNLATMLARQSQRVFMIDFDLEAPGLDSFGDLGLDAKQPGVVEYAYEFKQNRIAPELGSYVQECKLKQHIGGKLWLMPSGRKDEAYNSKRVKINWESLYDEGMGELFVENWKAAICRKYKPDYVFVDSRTGLTDVGGICTLHLPDLVVLLLGLNDQNLNGSSAVLQTIRNAKTVKPPQILPVATPVPNIPASEGNLLKERMDKAAKLLGMNIDCMVTYNPEAALTEKIFTLEGDPRRPSNRTGMEYRGILEKVQERNQNGLDALIRQAEGACKNDDEASAKRIKQYLLDDFGDRATALYQVGQIERFFNERESAHIHWRKAIELDPTYAEAFSAVQVYYKQKKKIQELLELHKIRERYVREHNPEAIYDILSDQGQDLMYLGLYVEAATCFHEIIKNVKPAQTFPLQCLIYTFNAAESARRATQRINPAIWKSAVSIFEKGVSVENLTVRAQANAFQAMYVAYACSGLVAKAKECLEKAVKCALLTGKAETIFSVKAYDYVPTEEFLATTSEMSEALKKNELWDGMVLPVV